MLYFTFDFFSQELIEALPSSTTTNRNQKKIISFLNVKYANPLKTIESYLVKV